MVPDDRSPPPIADDGGEPARLIFEQTFHAAHGKSEAINLGLDAASADGADWVALIDADVGIAVPDFGRLENLLELIGSESVLVGLAGRRICRSRVIPRESPRINLARQTTPIGYFQGFRIGDSPDRYPGPNDPGALEEHDDWRFYELFGDERCVALPFACYHMGEAGVHWGGFEGHLSDAASRPTGVPSSRTGEPFATLLGGASVLLIGVYGPADAEDLAGEAGVGELFVADPWELDQTAVESVEDLPRRLCGITGWRKGQWDKCLGAILSDTKTPPLAECVHPQST